MSRLGVILLVLLFVAVRGIYRWTWRPAERAATAVGREKALTTFVTFSLFLPPTIWVVTGWPAALDLPLPAWARLCCGVMGLAGDLVVLWAHAALRENFSPRLDLRPEHTLVRGGPYRWIRHPMYLGGILLSIGISGVAGNPAVGACLLVAMVLLLTIRVPDEERMLQERFGPEWDALAAETGRIFPRFSRKYR